MMVFSTAESFVYAASYSFVMTAPHLNCISMPSSLTIICSTSYLIIASSSMFMMSPLSMYSWKASNHALTSAYRDAVVYISACCASSSVILLLHSRMRSAYSLSVIECVCFALCSASACSCIAMIFCSIAVSAAAFSGGITSLALSRPASMISSAPPPCRVSLPCMCATAYPRLHGASRIALCRSGFCSCNPTEIHVVHAAVG